MITQVRQEFMEFAKSLNKAIRLEREKRVDDFCDEHNVSDEDRKEFKKVNPIKVY